MYGRLRETFGVKCKAFVERCATQPKQLVLDGTGPRVTMLLPFLKAAGMDNLRSFDRIYAFSGGVYAFFNCVAYHHGAYVHPVEHYYKELDKKLRSSHRHGRLPLFNLLQNYLRKQPLFPRQPFREVMDFSFTQEFLDTRLVEVAPNFYPLVGVYGKSEPLPLTAEHGFDRDNMTVRDALTMSVKIPFLYGGNTKDDRFFDANYASGFLLARNKLLNNGHQTLLMTMWEKKDRPGVDVVNIARGRPPKKIIRNDVLSILFNFPNRYYEEDLKLTYED
jgi:hypothetical protein